jgi:putative DNA primase/helicase
MNTIERAHGRWKEILPLLGVEPRFLVNRHGPCPLCGGKDRFRFDDKDGSGSYYCNGCGAGVGIIMLRKLHRWDHATACHEIDKVLGSEPISPKPASSSKGSRADRLGRLERVIAEATDPEIVNGYISARGLNVVPTVLRGHRSLAFHDDGGRFVGRFPAIVAPVIGPDGKLQSVHRTYVADLPKRKKIMPPLDTIRGGAVRLFDVDDEMGIAEGIETAIACTELFEIPSWAAISAGGMESFEPPAGINRVHIFGDNDGNFAGQKAAFVLAHRLARDIAVEVSVPLKPGADWLDMLNEGTEQ